MEAINAERQLEELLTLQDQWYNDSIEIKTPALFNRLKRLGKIKGTLDVKKNLSFEISCLTLFAGEEELHDLILSFGFPFDYPNDSVCNVKALSAEERANGQDVEYKACTAKIQCYLEAFRGCDCVELAIDWVSQNRDTCLKEKDEELNDEVGKGNNDGKVQCWVLRYNHLLSGPEHKKEKAMLDTAKKVRFLLYYHLYRFKENSKI